MDVLADVLSVTRLGATVIAEAELVPPWGLEIDPLAAAAVHVVERGSCWLRLRTKRRRPIRLDAGDLVLIRAGIAHSICDDPRTRPEPYRQVLAAMPRRLAALPRSRASETTVVLCAKYLFQHEGLHPIISLVPELIHLPAREVPEASWSVEALARRVAQSRATFARPFAELVGETPVAYLTRWRMCLAAKLLRESEAPLDEIASRVGYESAAALSKAFRRCHGMAPGSFRARARGEEGQDRRVRRARRSA